MWSDSERVVIDTRDYQRLLDITPGIELGPFEPGLFSIDLVAIGADSPELQNAVSGSSAPDLKELAEKLPAALDEVEQTSTDPPIFVGSTTSACLIEAQGTDVEDIARSVVAGMAQLFPVSIDVLTELVVEVYESAQAEVVIERDNQGLLRVLSTRQDLSGLFSALFGTEELLPGITDQEREEATEALKDAEFIMETRNVYEADIDLEVPLPPATTEDRTEQWREFFINAGFDS